MTKLEYVLNAIKENLPECKVDEIKSCKEVLVTFRKESSLYYHEFTCLFYINDLNLGVDGLEIYKFSKKTDDGYRTHQFDYFEASIEDNAEVFDYVNALLKKYKFI